MRLKSMVRFLIGALVFLLVGCDKKDKKEITVLIRMMPAQQYFFENEIIPQFENIYNCKVNLKTFVNSSDIKRMLDLDRKKSKPEISLVKTPFEVTRQLVDDTLLQRLKDAVDTSKIDVDRDMAVYHSVAAALAMNNEEFYYIPRKLETRILFYRKSKVADALAKFEGYKKTINKELKAMNGYGLPAGYTFEENPSKWDFYDLFVVGYIWANEEYNGSKYGRIAHRGARYNGTALFLIDRAFQLGATQDDIRRTTGDAVAETFLWESAFKEKNLYNTGMWVEAWRGANLYNAVKDGKAYLAYFQQIDCFTVHGWPKDPGMPSFLKDPSDMGVAVIPQGVSFSLDESGKPKIEGTRKITTGGWWWGIPKAAPESELAYKFAKYISTQENNARESSQFGMIPVRKDILLHLQNVFTEGWVGEIYKVSVQQINEQLDESITIVPKDREYSDMAGNYIEAWYDLMTNEKSKVGLDVKSVKTFLDEKYVPKARKIFGDKYPEQIEIQPIEGDTSAASTASKTDKDA